MYIINFQYMEGIIGPSLLTPASKFAWIFCHAVKGMVRKSPWVRETLSILYFLLIHMLMTMILTMTVCKQQSVIKSWNIIVGVSGTTAQRKFSALLVTTVVILLDFIWVNYNISLTWIKAIKGDDLPYINQDSRVRENSEVVMKFTQIYIYIYNSLVINGD